MPLYTFTVRAKDNAGAFADRDFSINVRNTITDIVVVAGGTNGALTSTDGTSWTTRPAPKGARITYGNGLWVNYGTNPTSGSYGIQNYWTSLDGINWNQYSTPESVRGSLVSNGPVIRYGNGRWMMAGAMVVGASSVFRAYTSADGVVWNLAHSSATYVRYGSLAYGGGKWIMTTGAPSDAASSTQPAIVSADNGVTWTPITFPVATNGVSILYVNGLWVMTTYGSSVWTSIDGINWAQRSLPNNTGAVMRSWDITYGNGTFVCVSYNTENLATHGWYSRDGVNWTRITTGESNLTDGSTTGCGFSEGKFFIAKASKLFSSLDGVTWAETAVGLGGNAKGGVSGRTMG